MKNSTIIKGYSTALIKGFYERVVSTKRLRHNLSKGEIRGLFFDELLSDFLTENLVLELELLWIQMEIKTFRRI